MPDPGTNHAKTMIKLSKNDIGEDVKPGDTIVLTVRDVRGGAIICDVSDVGAVTTDEEQADTTSRPKPGAGQTQNDELQRLFS